MPEPEFLLLGEFPDTVPKALERIGERAALAHFDVGTEDLVADAELVSWLAPAAAPLVHPGGVVVSAARCATRGGRRCRCRRGRATAATSSMARRTRHREADAVTPARGDRHGRAAEAIRAARLARISVD